MTTKISMLAMELAFILWVLFFLQGLAVMHALTRARQMSSFWLVGMYVLLVIAQIGRAHV